MAASPTRIVLVASDGEPWTSSCEKALKERGIETVEAYSCWSAEARRLHGGEAVVIDGKLLCTFVSEDRPGPVLGLSPNVPVVVFNAEALDERHRSAALSHDASIMDGNDVAEIARRVESFLPHRSVSA